MRLLFAAVGLLVLGLAAALKMPPCDGWGEWPKPPVWIGWLDGAGVKVPDLDCDWDEGGGGGTMRVATVAWGEGEEETLEGKNGECGEKLVVMGGEAGMWWCWWWWSRRWRSAGGGGGSGGDGWFVAVDR